MHVPQAPLRQPYGSIRSARIAAVSTVSPSSQRKACSLGFMVISNVMAKVPRRVVFRAYQVPGGHVS